ncbi:STAS domain-containing protein [Chondromyces crocatus]|uniref:Anti-anti-sigma factor n=1 Tax=Chondromyces crocatus TaxID=52 RepID=A0A0K1EB71_CHOCO|nr:STAS domain-containing protein [Chondromyces crocatus]AKT38105.1 anti-anti-sigma factor [Chondromyces crocatus]
MSVEEFFSVCPAMLFITNLDGRLERTSTALKNTLGVDDTPGQPLRTFIHPDDQGVFDAAWARVQTSSEPVTLRARFREADGHSRHLSCRMARPDEGPTIHGSLHQHLVEADPVCKEALFDAIAAHLPVGIWALDEEGKFLLQEGATTQSMGLAPRQYVGQNVFALHGDADVVRTHVREALAGRATHYLSEMMGVHCDNWMVPIHDDDGRQFMTLGFSMDITRVHETQVSLRERIAEIEQQREIIRQLSTPIIEVWDGVLTLPMLGILDSSRTADVMQQLLARIEQDHASFAILDLTGVEMIDTGVAGYIIRLVSAIRLLGAEGIVSGIRPTVAQTMVAVGADLSQIVTHRNLRAALTYCIRQMTPRPASQPRRSPHE